MIDLIRECSVNWGSVADWVGIIATFGLFTVAFVAIRTDRQQLAMLREDQLRRQAARVSAWVSNVFIGSGSEVGNIRVMLHNGGEEPVYDIAIRPTLRDYDVDDGLKGMHPPDGKDRPVDLTFRRPKPKVRERSPTPGAASVEIDFTDANGRRWTRTAKGRLSFIPE